MRKSIDIDGNETTFNSDFSHVNICYVSDGKLVYSFLRKRFEENARGTAKELPGITVYTNYNGIGFVRALNKEVLKCCIFDSVITGAHIPYEILDDKNTQFYVKDRSKMTDSQIITALRKSHGPGARAYYNEVLEFSKLRQGGLNYSVNKCRGFATQKAIKGVKASSLNALLAEELASSTFGVELETSGGLIPLNEVLDNNFYPLRDGSIGGIEFTSGVLHGLNGLKSIDKFTDIAEKQVNITTNESFHVHIRTEIMTKIHFMRIYRLIYELQDEIFSMFPAGMGKTSLFKRSGKDYALKIPNYAGQTFADIYNMYGGRRFDGFGEDTAPHPSDSNRNSKWHINTRYMFCNFVATLFNSANTVEFRIHPPTMDQDKIKLWVLLCKSIVQYGHGYNSSSKGKATLDQVIAATISNESLRTLMYDYVDGRKKYYTTGTRKLTRKMISDNKSTGSGILISKFIKKHIGLNEINNDSNELFMGENYLSRYDLK